jgi:hypothetical protein
VKGHQDNKISYTSLPLPAQLNVDADRTLSIMFHFFLAAKCSYYSAARLLQEIFQAPSVSTKDIVIGFPICSSDTDGRTADVTASVNWNGFAAAYKSSFQQQKFVFKFCMKLLPTGKTLHQQESRFDDRCPACSSPQESNNHMFQCPDISRQRWQSSTSSALWQPPKNDGTNPVLVEIMMAGLDSYFQAKPFNYSEFMDALSFQILSQVLD